MDEWMPVAKQSMFHGMKAKFRQNARAKNFLMNTNTCTLAEASRNSEWGTGFQLSDEKNGTRAAWTGKNTTGEVLMNVRGEILR